MKKYTFATQKGKAYYYNSIPYFIQENADSIIGELVQHSFEVNKNQTDAWKRQIEELQCRLSKCGIDGDIIFEYDIVRMGKRIDVIMLIRHMVFSMEFKNGKTVFTAQDAQQAEDYAIDIKNFHKESENLYVCPILIATDAPPYKKDQKIGSYDDKQIFLQRENIETLMPKLQKIAAVFGDDEKIDLQTWFNSPYYPTPTIIDAAVQAYHTHNLTEIAHSEAGQEDIEKCEQEIQNIINYARDNHKKCICFVTGVPGAGKTLVGLDIVSRNLEKKGKVRSVYLSGNGPLVEVLRAALEKSVKDTGLGEDKRNIKESIRSIIQGSFEFRKDNMIHVAPTAEQILIFDEAQRVWNREKMFEWTSKKMNEVLSVSEPQFMIGVMDRQKDWAVMICLVGLGQDIYNGEVGINEWFRSAIEDYENWELFYSPDIFSQVEDKNINREIVEGYSGSHACSALHLKTSIRSFRADKQSQFVDTLLENNPQEAQKIYAQIVDKYPIFITRNFKVAKDWARSHVRGSQRCGVLACSTAQRLKPEGIFVPTNIDVKNWFLAPSTDIRSSNMMEVVASEFKVQGLEIDWAVVCWDGDLRRTADNSDWDYFTFRGTAWQHRRKSEQQRYLLNSYRVLLTRARQGMIIFVPQGVDEEIDPTRNSKIYDRIFSYLKECGIKEL